MSLIYFFQLSANLAVTESYNILLLSSSMNPDPVATASIITLTVTQTNPLYEVPCLTFVHCETCANIVSCNTMTGAWHYYELFDYKQYKTTYEFRCPEGTKFFDSTTNLHHLSETRECLWDKNWTPDEALPPCTRKNLLTIKNQYINGAFLYSTCLCQPSQSIICY